MFYESRWVQNLNQCIDLSLKNGTKDVEWPVSTCPEKHLCLRATTFKCISFRDTRSFVVSCVSELGVHINHHSTLWAGGSAGEGSLLIGSLWQRRKSRWETQIWKICKMVWLWKAVQTFYYHILTLSLFFFAGAQIFDLTFCPFVCFAAFA